MENKIAIIGPYPPPYGGISVHIERTLSYLKDDDYILFAESKAPSHIPSKSFSGKIRFLKALQFFFKKFKLIHHHSPDLNMRLLLSLVGIFRKNIYLHIHGASLEDAFKKGGLRSFLLKRLMRFVHVLADNSDIVELVQPYCPRSIHEIDAFLPPVFNLVEFNQFSERVQLTKSNYLVFMCGWFMEYKGEDLYGFDIALETLYKARINLQKDIQIVASVNGVASDTIYQKFLKRRKELELESSFVLLDAKFKEIWPFYIKADLFLRPTMSDGSSLSVKEALWFETSTLASDAVPRPEGCSTFKTRSSEDLERKLTALLQKNLVSPDEKLQRLANKSFSYPLFNKIYKL